MLLWSLFAIAAAADIDAPPDLTGLWRLDLRIATLVDLPVVGSTQVASRQVILGRVEEGPAGLEMVHKVCAIDADTKGGITRTTIPPAFINSLQDRRYPLTLEADGAQWRYRADARPVVIGFDPRQTGGAVPAAPADPGVVDFERDGDPGATFYVEVPLIGAVEVYVAQATHTLYDGVVGPDGVRGSLALVDLRQNTIGASNRLFAANPKITPDSKNSTFSMVRAPAGATCETLLGG